MRALMHPLLFYPLVLLAAALIVAFGLEPQRWPRAPHPVAGETQGQGLVLHANAFDAPSGSPEQHMIVVRDFWGRPLSLRIAVLPDQPAPTPAERGVRILLTPEAAALLEERPVIVEVHYNPLQQNSSTALAVSLQGIAPADWVTRELPAQPGAVRFELPAQFAVDAIGFRAISTESDLAHGLEITSVRITPQA
jgi:hypothetical protein